MYMIYLIPFLLFSPLLILQLTVIPFFAIENVVPDLTIILLVIIAIRRGQIQGTIYGFLFGLLLDVFTGGLIGSAMFSKTLAGFIAGYFYSENPEDSTGLDLKFVGLIFMCASIDSFFYSLLGTAELSSGIQYFIFDYSLFPGLYTSVICLPLVGLKRLRIPI
jgi:rod shape-determining protein MreD